MKDGPSHLVRRALTSWRNSPLSESEKLPAVGILHDGEYAIWNRMQPRDQRHSLVVLSRLKELLPGASRAELAAALLHDIGKTRSDLGWSLRVVATVVGPRGRRFTDYHDHEAIGAELLVGTSDPETVALVGGTAQGPALEALRAADSV